MFESPAFAATTGAASGGTAAFMVQIFPLLLIFVIFYFLLIRPQQRRVRQHQDMVGAVKPRDTAVTTGGLIGKVTKLGDQYLGVELAPGVEVQVQRTAVTQVLPKGSIK